MKIILVDPNLVCTFLVILFLILITVSTIENNYFLVRTKLGYLRYRSIFNSFTCNENFSSVCSNHTEISAQFTVMKFLPVIVILLLSSLSMRDVFSSSPVDIRRRFNVYKSSTSYRRLIDIETTSCVYWVTV